MFEILENENKNAAPIKHWTKHVPFEDGAKEQVKNLAAMPFVTGHVAIMPDVHYGKGATIGSVFATKGAVIPAAVGVDIGCGCRSVKTKYTANQLPDSLVELRNLLENDIPAGGPGAIGCWSEEDAPTEAFSKLSTGLKSITDKHPLINNKYMVRQLGSLGSGNHFFEVCLDEDQNIWLMVHSGSRGIGHTIGSYFTDRAIKLRGGENLPDKYLSYLFTGTELFDDYLEAAIWAQAYAKLNRDLMMIRGLAALRGFIEPYMSITTWGTNRIDCHHNYVSKENIFGEDVLVTRKGAVSAREGEYGIVPGSMGAKSFIVKGKGNPESLYSCSHGAGRAMSRTQARKVFTLEDHAKAVKGVECRLDKGVIDETPMAYKSIDDVMKSQTDLVSIEHTLKQILCIKG